MKKNTTSNQFSFEFPTNTFRTEIETLLTIAKTCYLIDYDKEM